jgi:hypothetical protein
MCASTFWTLRFSSTITRTLSTLPGGAEREPGCDDPEVGVGTESASGSVQEVSPDSKAAITTATASCRHRAQALARLPREKTCIASVEFSCRSRDSTGRLSEASAGANERHGFLLVGMTGPLPASELTQRCSRCGEAEKTGGSKRRLAHDG